MVPVPPDPGKAIELVSAILNHQIFTLKIEKMDTTNVYYSFFRCFLLKSNNLLVKSAIFAKYKTAIAPLNQIS